MPFPSSFGIHNLILISYILLQTVNADVVCLSNFSIPNPSFESSTLAPWTWWSRDTMGYGVPTTAFSHSGSKSAHLFYASNQDYSFSMGQNYAVNAGDMVYLSVWVKPNMTNWISSSNLQAAVELMDASHTVFNWAFGANTLSLATASSAALQGNWVQLTSQFIIPNGTIYIQPRILGYYNVDVYVDDYSMCTYGHIPPTMDIASPLLRATLDTTSGSLTVVDVRTSFVWKQKAVSTTAVVTDGRVLNATAFQLDMKLGSSLLAAVQVTFVLDPVKPELFILLSAFNNSVRFDSATFPQAFVTPFGSRIIWAGNEGYSLPVNYTKQQYWSFDMGTGYQVSMPWFGGDYLTADYRLGYAYLAIVNTPDDCAYVINPTTTTEGATLWGSSRWSAQKGKWGYDRSLRYVFFTQGGHVALAQRYREDAISRGMVVTHMTKRAAHPAENLLVGAVNLWAFVNNSPKLLTELTTVFNWTYILWSSAQSSSFTISANNAGFLTGKYDIYQDVYDPSVTNYPGYPIDPWLNASWPTGLLVQSSGSYLQSWVSYYPGGQVVANALCDVEAPAIAATRVPLDQLNAPRKARFIDTSGSAGWHECYSGVHPMTRSDSRAARVQLAKTIYDAGLVVGTETGNEVFAPYVSYFEGMMSLGFGRSPNSGYNIQSLSVPTPSMVWDHQVNYVNRLPLWELVYHDCVEAHWYWGDSQSKEPDTWDRRDLFNILYGTAPMFVFNDSTWTAWKDRYNQSYFNIVTVTRRLGYTRMVDHAYLTNDFTVQQTTWSPSEDPARDPTMGARVTVNFGTSSYALTTVQGNLYTLAGGSFLLENMTTVASSSSGSLLVSSSPSPSSSPFSSSSPHISSSAPHASSSSSSSSLISQSSSALSFSSSAPPRTFSSSQQQSSSLSTGGGGGGSVSGSSSISVSTAGGDDGGGGLGTGGLTSSAIHLAAAPHSSSWLLFGVLLFTMAVCWGTGSAF